MLNNRTPDKLNESLLGNWTPFAFFENSPFAGTLTLLLLLVGAFAAYPFFLWVVQKNNYFGVPEWKSRNQTGKVLGWWIAAMAVVAFVEFQPIAIIWFSNALGEVKSDGVSWMAFFRANVDDGIRWQDIATMLGATGTVLASLTAGKLAPRISGFAGKLGFYLLGLLGFLLLWLIYLNLCRWVVFPETMPDWLSNIVIWLPNVENWFAEKEGSSNNNIIVIIFYFVIALVIWLYSVFFVDVNYTSLHNFYRDRLSKAFLIRLGNNDDLEHNDTQRLSALNSVDAPYHLINAAINLNAPGEDFRRGRRADTFLFSKFYIGTPLTGYCETTAMERVRPHVNLGTAMAISGASFAGTAGKATIKPLAFLMAMLNVRLNYWLPNPAFVAKHGWWAGSTFNRAGPIYLLKELFGQLNANSWNVDISDGGHFENLGVYELLRRECRLIIVGDGECDPKLKFEAVSELVRLAQIDMGIKIEMEGLDKIRAGKQHHAIGTVHYSKSRKGVLIYLKSSLLKDDTLEASLPSKEAYLTSCHRKDDRQYDSNPYIAHYKAKNPSFPHQTTGDQFFDERQFECYRALGYMVAMRSIGDWKTPTG